MYLFPLSKPLFTRGQIARNFHSALGPIKVNSRMEQFSRTVFRNSAWSMTAQFLIKLLSFGFSLLIVRNLGVDAFGQYSAVLAFAVVFYFVADLGLSPYTVREVARWRDSEDGLAQTNQIYSNVVYLRLILSVLATAITVVAAWWTGRPTVMIIAIVLSNLGLVLWALHGANSAVMSGLERVDLANGANVINQVVFIAAGTAALYWGGGYYGLIIASVLGTALMTVVSWRILRTMQVHLAHPDLRRWLPLLAASLPFGIMTLAQNLSLNFDSVILNVTRGDVETGYYGAVYGLVFSAVVISNVLNTTLYPSLTRQSVNNSHLLSGIYQRALRYLMLISLPIAVGTWALADQIVPFLFKAAYLPAVPALQIIIWVVPFMFASEFLGYVVFIQGHERYAARAITLSTGFNVALNLVLIPRVGFMGAAVITVLTEIILVGQYLWMLREQLQGFQWGPILFRPLVAALLMGGLVLALHGLPLFVNIAIGALFYGTLLLLFRVLGNDELRFVLSLRRRAEERVTQ